MGPKLSDEVEFIDDKFDELYKIVDDIQYDDDDYENEYDFDIFGGDED